MIPILYKSDEMSFTSNGIGRLRDCIKVTVSEERNGIFECDFSYPIDGANFEKIQCGRIIAVRHDDSDDVQPFDIVSYSKPIDGIVTFHAVHISYRQRGLVASGKNVNTLDDAFALLGNSTPSNPFSYEADFTSTAYMAAADGTPRSVRSLLGGVQGSILDTYGGEYEFDRFRVILHKRRGTDRDFTIRYGVNLLDYKEDTDYQETYNAAVPYWTGSDGVKDVIVIGNAVKSDSPTYAGRDIYAALDLTDKFETKPTKAQLSALALSLINSNQTTLPQQTINVDFVRLQDLGEYESLKSLLQCNLCDTIEVVFPRYNMRGRFKIVKTVFDVLRGKYERLELGALQTTLAEALGITQGGDRKSVPDVIFLNEDGEVQVNTNMLVSGSLTVAGHSTPVGSRVAQTDVTVNSIASGGSLKDTGCSVDLTAGTWIIDYYGRFPANATGYRGIALAYGSEALTRSGIFCQASNSSAVTTRLAGSVVQTISADRNYKIQVMQGSGSSMNGIVVGIVATRLI